MANTQQLAQKLAQKRLGLTKQKAPKPEDFLQPVAKQPIQPQPKPPDTTQPITEPPLTPDNQPAPEKIPENPMQLNEEDIRNQALRKLLFLKRTLGI